MKNTLITTLAIGGLLALSPLLFADDTNSPATPPAARHHMRGGSQLDRLANMLNLTDDQKAKVKPILQAQFHRMRALRQDTSLTMKERRHKMQAIHRDTVKKLKDVLTPEQFAKYRQMMRRGRHHGPPPGDNNLPPANPPQQ